MCIYAYIHIFIYIYSAYFCACILRAMTPETGVIQRKWKGAKIEGSRKGVFLSREGYSPPCSIYPRFLGTWVLVVYIYICVGSEDPIWVSRVQTRCRFTYVFVVFQTALLANVVCGFSNAVFQLLPMIAAIVQGPIVCSCFVEHVS